MNKTKIIIGYRYDPETNSMQRLKEIQCIQNQQQTKPNNANSVTTSHNDQQNIRLLKNQNLLLKTQIKRIMQKSSFQAYKQVSQSYLILQKQCKKLKLQVTDLQKQISFLKQKYKNSQIEKSTQRSSQLEKYHGRKYTFSPYHNSNSDDQIPLSSKKDFKKSPSLNQSLVNNIFSSKPSQKQLQKQRSMKSMNSERSTEKQMIKSAPYQMFQGINSEFLYNNLKTVQSEKSQQIESQIVLDGNFSFMPKPLRINRDSLKLLPEQRKKVSFKQEANVLFSSKEFSFANRSPKSSQQINERFMNESLDVGQQLNQYALSGLRKLPSKPVRIQTCSSNSITDE